MLTLCLANNMNGSFDFLINRIILTETVKNKNRRLVNQLINIINKNNLTIYTGYTSTLNMFSSWS